MAGFNPRLEQSPGISAFDSFSASAISTESTGLYSGFKNVAAAHDNRELEVSAGSPRYRDYDIFETALLDHWRLFENSGDHPHLVAEETRGQLIVIDPHMLARVERSASVAFMSQPGEKSVEELSIYTPAENTRRAMRAMRKAFADAVLENLRYGLPVIQWKDDKVVEVPAEQLAPLARRILAANGEPLPEDR